MVPFNRAELFTNLNVSLPAPPTRREIPLNDPIEVPPDVVIFPLFVPEITILAVWLASRSMRSIVQLNLHWKV